MYASSQLHKVRVALRKSRYLSNIDEKKNHHALNNTDCQLNEMLEDFTWQAEERMKSILKSNCYGASQSKTVKPPIFSPKTKSDEYNLIENMSDIICQTYKMLDVLEKTNAILYIFKKEVDGKSKKIHIQFYLKLLDLAQTSSTKTVHDDIHDFDIE